MIGSKCIETTLAFVAPIAGQSGILLASLQWYFR